MIVFVLNKTSELNTNVFQDSNSSSTSDSSAAKSLTRTTSASSSSSIASASSSAVVFKQERRQSDAKPIVVAPTSNEMVGREVVDNNLNRECDQII